MPIKATEVKKGQFLIWKASSSGPRDRARQAREGTGVRPGQDARQVGGIKINRLNSDDRLDEVNVDRREMQFLYDSGGQGEVRTSSWTTRPTTRSRSTPRRSPRSRASGWRTECIVSMFDGKPLSIQLPSLELTISDTAPQAKGATASNQNKGVRRDRRPHHPTLHRGRTGRQGQSRDRRVHGQGLNTSFSPTVGEEHRTPDIANAMSGVLSRSNSMPRFEHARRISRQRGLVARTTRRPGRFPRGSGMPHGLPRRPSRPAASTRVRCGPVPDGARSDPGSDRPPRRSARGGSDSRRPPPRARRWLVESIADLLDHHRSGRQASRRLGTTVHPRPESPRPSASPPSGSGLRLPSTSLRARSEEPTPDRFR